MTIEEIFTELSAHLVEGIMIHDQMSSYYNFLSLKGYGKCHEYHYWNENYCYIKVKQHFFKYHNKLIKEKNLNNPNIIPKSWYSYNREEVDISTKRNSVKSGLEKWLEWEKSTKELYKKLYENLVDLKEFNDAKLMEELICDVEEEIAHAEKEYIKRKTTDFSIEPIVADQHWKYIKYKEKIQEGDF